LLFIDTCVFNQIEFISRLLTVTMKLQIAIILALCAFIAISGVEAAKKSKQTRSVKADELATDAAEKAADLAAVNDEKAQEKIEKAEEKKREDKKALEYNVKRCPAGWYRFENAKCFKHVPDLLTQADAEIACQALGSTLASIHNEAERTFIKSLVLKESTDETTLGKVWIGLRRKANEFYNFDLSPVSSTLSWFEGHPEAGLGHCATLACDYATSVNSTGNFCKVHLNDCNEGHSYVCQKQIIIYTHVHKEL